MANAGSGTDKSYDMYPKSSRGTNAFEFFLYAAIIVTTALAAFVDKGFFRNAGFASLDVPVAVVYFGFLAWAIVQLNLLHHQRKLQKANEPEAAPMQPETVAVVQDGAAARRILGLTAAQVIAVFVVFGAALVSFSWAFSNLHPSR